MLWNSVEDILPLTNNQKIYSCSNVYTRTYHTISHFNNFKTERVLKNIYFKQLSILLLTAQQHIELKTSISSIEKKALKHSPTSTSAPHAHKMLIISRARAHADIPRLKFIRRENRCTSRVIALAHGASPGRKYNYSLSFNSNNRDGY